MRRLLRIFREEFIVELLLPLDFNDPKIESFKGMIDRVKEAYPNAGAFATTLRQVVSANCHLWGAIVREEGLVRLKTHDVSASAEQEELASKVESLLAAAGASPPKAGLLADQAGIPVGEVGPILDMLADRGSILKLEDGIYAHSGAATRAKGLLVTWLKEKGQIGVIDFRDLIGTTRKYVYVWLDHFDRTGVTYRAENLRYLAS